MASRALTEFNAFVDGLSLNPTQKANLKLKGEVFYAAVVKEEAHHIRKHLLAAREANPEKADFFNGILQKVVDEDSRLTIETAQAISNG